MEKDPKAVVGKLAAPSLVDKGDNLASKGEIQKAITKYQQAQELDPQVDLNPDTDTLDKDPKAVAQHQAALGKIEKGRDLVWQGEIEQAITSYKEAQELDSTVKIPAYYWNTLCRYGSLHGQAANVLEACTNAVALAPETDKGWYRDSRGIARAMTGDKQGAIEDFQAFIESTDSNEEKQQRQGWIDDLQAGKNPFTEEEIERLLRE